MATIDETTLANMLTAMGAEIGRAIATANTAAQATSDARATDDRAALLQSMRGLVRSSGGERHERTDRKASEKEDLSASIIKAQSVTVDFLKENTFNPDDQQIQVWKADVIHTFRSKHCEDVTEWAGHMCYIRQSNDLFFHLLEHEKDYRERHAGRESPGMPADGPDRHDRPRMYFDGKVELQGRHILRWRKLLMRQALGYQYVPVLVAYDFDTLDLAAYISGVTTTGTGAARTTTNEYSLSESSSWAPALIQLLTYASDNRHFVANPRRTTINERRKDLVTQYENCRSSDPNGGRTTDGTTIRDLWAAFHRAFPNVVLPVSFEPQYGLRRRPTIPEMDLEPLQVPIIPDEKATTITIRHHGCLISGYNFTLRRITQATDERTDLVPVEDNDGHIYVAADDTAKRRYIKGFPINAAYDDRDLTGQFNPTKAMSSTMWAATDSAVF